MKGGPITRSRGVSQDPFWVLWRTAMPAVLVEVGFITHAKDLQAMRSPEGREKIADNLFQAFKTFKTRYDGSAAVPEKAAPRVKEEKAPEKAVKKMKSSDPFFRGYAPTAVSSGKLYKYLILPDPDLSVTRKKFKEVSGKFPGCFIVKKTGDSLTRIP